MWKYLWKTRSYQKQQDPSPWLALSKNQNVRISLARFSQQRSGKVAHAVPHKQQKKVFFFNFLTACFFPVTARVSGS